MAQIVLDNHTAQIEVARCSMHHLLLVPTRLNTRNTIIRYLRCLACNTSCPSEPSNDTSSNMWNFNATAAVSKNFSVD